MNQKLNVNWMLLYQNSCALWVWVILNSLTNLVVSLDKELIDDAFNIHFDNQKRTVVVSILDSVGVNQNVIGPTLSGGHTFDLILTYGLNIETIDTLPLSEAISDHYLISFKLCIDQNICTLPSYCINRTLRSATAQSFINNLRATETTR